MQYQTLAKIAASTLVLGVTMVGCKPAAEGSRPRSAAEVGTRSEQQAGKAAEAAMAAVQKQDWATGVAQAEAAVALSPRDAGYRGTLAGIYLKAGRFDSAATAYSEALQTNRGDAKATLSLALTQIGLGRNADALATLRGGESALAPADHGLALALAGDKEGAIRLLSAAAREPDATARVRQNLALAFALAGDWTQARTIAAQDVAPDEIEARMASWAEFAQPKASYDQVATLLGVTPVADPGQPTRLALNNSAVENVQVAAADFGTVSDPAGAVMTESSPLADNASFADIAPEAEAAAAQGVPVQVAEAAPVEEAAVEAAPVFAAAIANVQRVLPQQMARPLARAIRASASAPVAMKGRFVVQLGAFASRNRVEQAWNGAVGRLDRLANYIPASTRFSAGGSSLTRLSVGGFATRQAATDLCNNLRRKGGVCFVRATAGDAPVRWASRAGRGARG